jgi:branched-subunit amino acid aminotransferase/4-amino-4-deoxychorismate lyase
MNASNDKTGNHVSLNGKLVPAAKAKVSVYDRGFTYGDSLIETMKLLDGRPVFFPEHYARLARGMAEAGMAPPPDESELWNRSVELAEADGVTGGRLRLQVTRGVAPPSEGPEPGAGYEPTLLVTAQEFDGYPERFYQEGMACISVPANRGAWATLKTSSLMTTVLARRQATSMGADEAIFTSAGNVLLEGAYTNIFFLSDGAYYTTPASENILHGITREKVLAIMESLGTPVTESSITLGRLDAGSDAAFLTGSLLGICPVRSIDSLTLKPDRQLAGRVNELLLEQEQESASRTYE